MDDLLELEAATDDQQQDDAQSADDQQQDDQQQAQDDQQQTDDQKAAVTSLFGADGRKFDPQVSAALTKIKAESPEVGKLLMRAVSRVGELDREFPGGLTEARELRDKVEELGGVAGIEQKMEGLAELDGLAQQFMAADPAFVEDLIASSPEAFAAMAPIVFQKFAETNSEGFGAYIGRVVYGDMQQNGLPLMLMRLADTIADNAKATEALQAINTYLGGFKTLSEKPMPAAKVKPSDSGKKDDLSAREEALRAKEWQGERDSAQKTIVNAEYTRCLAGRKPDTEEKGQIRELFLVRSKSAADRLFPGWQEKAQRFVKGGDKAGYLRYMQSIYKRIVPDAMVSSVNSTMKGKKPGAAGAAKKPAAATHGQAAAGAPSGFAPVAKEPSTWDVDYNRTSQAMLRENRAVLKDGKKVAWK